MVKISKLESELFKALAHPVRIEILELLTKKELCVCNIYKQLEKSQSSISQHLNKLKQNSLVTSRKEGLRVYYKVKDKRVIKILELGKNLLLEQVKETKELLKKDD